MSEITVCIPTYEYKGRGVEFLAELFDSLERQTFTDFDITYIGNPNGRGFQAPNTDCAIENAEGKIIKLIYQDDIFVDENALQKIYDSFKSGAKWLIHGFTHTTDGVETHRDCAPKWSPRMLEGDNLLGSPSCTAYLNGSYLGMDDEMKLLIDTELYHRMRMKHGMPSMLDDVLIANREHDNRTSSSGVNYDATISDSSRTWLVNKAEIEHIYKKHSDYFVTRKYPDEN